VEEMRFTSEHMRFFGKVAVGERGELPVRGLVLRAGMAADTLGNRGQDSVSARRGWV
jgi:hypothetical protein